MKFSSRHSPAVPLVSLLMIIAFSLPAATRGQSSASGGKNFDGPAELPREYVQSSLKDTPAPGKTWMVRAGDNLQQVLGKASCGDIIKLEAGATFSGNVVVPAKSCDDSHWIILRTSAPDSSLPGEGTQITPCYAGVSSLAGRPRLNCSRSEEHTS